MSNKGKSRAIPQGVATIENHKCIARVTFDEGTEMTN